MANNLFKPSNPYRKEPETNERRPKFSIMYYLVVILLLIGIQLAFFWSGSSVEIPYSTFRKYIAENKVESVRISPERIFVVLKPEAKPVVTAPEPPKDGPGIFMPRSSTPSNEIFVTPVRDDTLVELLESKGIKYQGMPSNTWLGELLQWILPFALL
ncbi:MAG: AAA family ATPase, partial [Chlorobium limicola]|nr:AAA family ATPase [Chlorobium limicola]